MSAAKRHRIKAFIKGSSGFNVPEVKNVDIKYIPLEQGREERRGTDVHEFNIPWIWSERVQLFKDGVP